MRTTCNRFLALTAGLCRRPVPRRVRHCGVLGRRQHEAYHLPGAASPISRGPSDACLVGGSSSNGVADHAFVACSSTSMRVTGYCDSACAQPGTNHVEFTAAGDRLATCVGAAGTSGTFNTNVCTPGRTQAPLNQSSLLHLLLLRAAVLPAHSHCEFHSLSHVIRHCNYDVLSFLQRHGVGHANPDTVGRAVVPAVFRAARGDCELVPRLRWCAQRWRFRRRGRQAWSPSQRTTWTG
jgi:hypothetical protein